MCLALKISFNLKELTYQ